MPFPNRAKHLSGQCCRLVWKENRDLKSCKMMREGEGAKERNKEHCKSQDEIMEQSQEGTAGSEKRNLELPKGGGRSLVREHLWHQTSQQGWQHNQWWLLENLIGNGGDLREMI